MRTDKELTDYQPDRDDRQLLRYGLESLASLIAELEYDRQYRAPDYSVPEYLAWRNQEYGRPE